MATKTMYRGYYIAPMPLMVDGHFESKVAVIALSGDRTRQQRFLDFEAYPTEQAATNRAIEGAKDWVDIELARQNISHLPSSSNLMSL